MAEMSEQLLAKLNKGREFRRIDFSGIQLRSEESGAMLVEGYATVFDQTYELWHEPGYIVREQVDRGAFDGCDMSDVIFLSDHTGRVHARTRNGTMKLAVDERGLKVIADLSGTEAGRLTFEEIKGGYVDKMSFSFVVAEDLREVLEDREQGLTIVTRHITRIEKLYDVSSVSFPANEATEISARGLAEGVIAGFKELEKLSAEYEKREKLKGEIRQLLAGEEQNHA